MTTDKALKINSYNFKGPSEISQSVIYMMISKHK